MNESRLLFVPNFLTTPNQYGATESYLVGLLILFHPPGVGQVYVTKEIVILTTVFIKVNISDI